MIRVATAKEFHLFARSSIHTVLLGLSLLCLPTGARADTPAEETPAAASLPYYSFRAVTPEHGYCEQQVFHRERFPREPVNGLFSLTALFLGLLGVYRSKRTTMIFQFLFGLLAGYGLFAALYHATLFNGFYRMMDVSLSFLQSLVIVMLTHSLYLYRVKTRGRPEKSDRYRVLTTTVAVLFTLYPAAVHVAGESAASPWVAWLVFDLLWVLIASLLVAIWFRRFTWPRTPANAAIFSLVWYAIGFCALAYAGWVVDKFICSESTPVLATIPLHGLWHLFIGLCFYLMITLNRYFSAHELGFRPEVERILRLGPLVLPFVEWQSRHNADRSRQSLPGTP